MAPKANVPVATESYSPSPSDISFTELSSSPRWEVGPWPEGEHELTAVVKKQNKSKIGFGFHTTDIKKIKRYIPAHDDLVTNGVLTQVGTQQDGKPIYRFTALKLRVEGTQWYPSN